MKKFLKIFIGIILGIIILIAVIIGGLNLFKYTIYSDYFEIRENLANNAGLGSGYVPQGVTKTEYNDEDVYFTSGYMGNGDSSRIYYITDETEGFVTVKLDDATYADSHFGGIAATKEFLYIATDKKVYIVKIDDIMTSDTGSVDVISTFAVDVEASFIYIDPSDNFLFVGEFYGYSYDTNDNHKNMVNSGKDEYNALVSCYYIDNLMSNKKNEPLYHFAIRDKVQGFAISDEYILLSTSYGLNSSYFYQYSIPKNYDKDNIYFLDDRYLIKEIKAPAMSEGLDYDGEKFITLFESACNKYFFGKLFFANKIVGLDI